MVGTRDFRVDASNAEQLRAWDGAEGEHWADNADRYDDALAGYQEPFIAAAAVTASDSVIDIGCGAGQCTREAGRAASSGHALGLDLSSRLVDVARRRATDEGA